MGTQNSQAPSHPWRWCISGLVGIKEIVAPIGGLDLAPNPAPDLPLGDFGEEAFDHV